MKIVQTLLHLVLTFNQADQVIVKHELNCRMTKTLTQKEYADCTSEKQPKKIPEIGGEI